MNQELNSSFSKYFNETITVIYSDFMKIKDLNGHYYFGLFPFSLY